MKGSHNSARGYALKLLSYRPRSKKEIIEKLKRKGFGDAELSDVIYFLQRTGLINDEALALNIYKFSADRKPLGKQGLNALLRKRGLDKEIIDNILALHSADAEEESARMLVAKKLKSLRSRPEDIAKRRLWGMLQRRGFSPDVINRVIKEL